MEVTCAAYTIGTGYVDKVVQVPATSGASSVLIYNANAFVTGGSSLADCPPTYGFEILSRPIAGRPTIGWSDPGMFYHEDIYGRV